jgi:endo-1,4-beta-xylanase
MKIISTIMITLLLFCSFQKKGEKGLKDYYQSYFPVGVAVSPNSLKGESGKFILSQFNSITPENAMKMGPIHPLQNRFFWRDADSIVAFGVKNNIKVRGHALCWHEQTPNWMFKNPEGSELTKDSLLNRLKVHINTVVKRYKGKIYAWDVVNEAIDDDSTKFLRNSDWYKICGEDFIVKAFEYAHEADPEAKLYYNDYNTERPEKRERIFKLLQKLVKAGVPIDGVGLQGHWSIFEPTEKELVTAIERFSSLGLDVQITEMDVSVYKWEKERRELQPNEQQSYTPELERLQTEKYASLFKTLRKYKKNITGVTFWNVSDKYTWLDEYPVKGRKNYPLLFDTKNQPKKAFWEVVKF